jgi:integrase/recombinase XerD
VDVAAYVEGLGKRMKPPSVKQHLACIRMLFDWLVTGQVVPVNPAHSVRGPRHSVSKGVTPVLSSEEAAALLAGMNVSTVVGLRDRAIIAVMTYTFARVGALVALNVEDYYSQKKRWWLRLSEKNGEVNDMPCHHKLESFLDAYIDPPASTASARGRCSVAAIGKTKKLSQGRMSRKDVWYMVRRRATDAGIETPIGCHTFRATGITDYLTNDGRIEVAQRMARHSNAQTTGLYDRRNDDYQRRRSGEDRDLNSLKKKLQHLSKTAEGPVSEDTVPRFLFRYRAFCDAFDCLKKILANNLWYLGSRKDFDEQEDMVLPGVVLVPEHLQELMIKRDSSRIILGRTPQTLAVSR